MRYGDRGAEVRALQQRLLDRGYALPRFGADGVLGDETWFALQEFARDEQLLWNPEVPIHVRAAVLGPADPGPEPTPPGETPNPAIERIDLRPLQTDPAPKTKVVLGRTVMRAPHSITGIVIHQTAVEFGISREDLRLAGGDPDLAQQRRALRVACHALAFREGWVVMGNDLRSYVWHANLLNSHTLGLEIEGNYAGIERDPSTAWRGARPSGPPDDLVVDTAREALRWLVDEGRRMGMPIEWVYAHRQSSLLRRNDPGETLWRRVVLDWGVPRLGLRTAPNLVVGDGRPIPEDWDPAGVGTY